jgi:hypothetical protein
MNAPGWMKVLIIARLGEVGRGATTKVVLATVAKKVASNPGPRPPSQELTITAPTNRRKGLRSLRGSSWRVGTNAHVTATTARP